VNYFFDTNIIIDIFDKKEEAMDKLYSIALEEDSEISINRLVYIEALRTIHYKYKNIFREAKRTLDSFTKVNIEQEIYDDAIEFSRFCHSKGLKLKGKCEAIDFLHFMTAKYYNLELVSNNKDFVKLETSYNEYTTTLQKETQN